MSWRYERPCSDDYDTEEEYERDLEAYERALDDYADDYMERHL